MPTILGLQARWELKELYEKDEDGEIVLKRGKPVVADSWILLYLRAPDGVEIQLDVEREPFEVYILPRLLEG